VQRCGEESGTRDVKAEGWAPLSCLYEKVTFRGYMTRQHFSSGESQTAVGRVGYMFESSWGEQANYQGIESI
jgi:hypothetical protein